MVDLNIQLPESFFQEEERCGYLVSAKTKELWAVQMDLLNELDRVCKKYNLKYFFDFGSLLGAVRHKGFIPWDEDIDVSMLREDYDKLMEIGPKEFKHPYFLQNYKTEKNYDISVTRLRRSDTTFIQPWDLLFHNKYNLGIFIDIFVFDNVPTDEKNIVSEIHDQSMSFYRKVLALVHGEWNHSNLVIRTVLFIRYLLIKLLNGSSYNAFKHMERISTQFEKSPYVSCVFTQQPVRCRQRKWLEDIIYVPFETLKVPVPAAYDEVLKECYGDYMTPMVDSTPKVWFFDANTSYKDMICKKGFYENLMKKLSINPKDYEVGVKELLNLLKKKITSKFGI